VMFVALILLNPSLLFEACVAWFKDAV